MKAPAGARRRASRRIPHYCLGAPPARLDAGIALRTLLERCPGLAPDPAGAPLDRLPGLLIRGVRRLPVVW
uniref:hypothetical protein n=1 Tax=Streptomyces marianii TaxID=1817406 RepID=UPI002678DCCB